MRTVVVVDLTGSMQGVREESAKQLARRIHTVYPASQFFGVHVNDTVIPLNPIAPWPHPTGQGDVYAAGVKICEHFEDVGRLFVITDGEVEGSPARFREAMREKGVRLTALILDGDEFRNEVTMARALAQLEGGS